MEPISPSYAIAIVFSFILLVSIGIYHYFQRVFRSHAIIGQIKSSNIGYNSHPIYQLKLVDLQNIADATILDRRYGWLRVIEIGNQQIGINNTPMKWWQIRRKILKFWRPTGLITTVDYRMEPIFVSSGIMNQNLLKFTLEVMFRDIFIFWRRILFTVGWFLIGTYWDSIFDNFIGNGEWWKCVTFSAAYTSFKMLSECF